MKSVLMTSRINFIGFQGESTNSQALLNVDRSSVRDIIKSTCDHIDSLKKTRELANFPSYLTAIHRNRPSEPIINANKVIDFNGKIGIDIGCGRSIDAEWVESHGGRCYKFDPVYWSLNKKGNHFDIPADLCSQDVDFLFAIYVLNVLTRRERALVAGMLQTIIKPGGLLVIGVREDFDSIKGNWHPFEDGFVTSKGTFQTFFPHDQESTKNELDFLFPSQEKHRVGRATWLIQKN